MTTRLLLTLLLVLACAAPALAQDPCASPTPTATELNPTKVYAILPDHTAVLLDTQIPTVSSYQLALFPKGQGPTGIPTVLLNFPKTAFTLVPGSASCYFATLPTIAQNTAFVSYMRAHRDAVVDPTGAQSLDAVDSDWSVVSNPFVLVPLALAAPGHPIIRR